MKPKRSTKSEEYRRPQTVRGSRISSESMRKNDEPMPMRNNKPVHKHPNAVDNFWKTHQSEYDWHGTPPDRQRYVDSHNDACPKLKDELDKKRDIHKPIAVQTLEQKCQAAGVLCATQTFLTERDWADPNCIMCSERKRCARIRTFRGRERERKSRKSRISKSRRRPRLRRLIKLNKQTRQNDPSIVPNDPKSSEVESTHYPETLSLPPSVSSYNSFLSETHGPMGSK